MRADIVCTVARVSLEAALMCMSQDATPDDLKEQLARFWEQQLNAMLGPVQATVALGAGAHRAPAH